MSRRTDLDTYFEWALRRPEVWQNSPIAQGRGLRFYSSQIDSAGGDTLAAWINRKRDTDPVLRLVLPNPLTAVRYRAIRDAAHRAGITTVTVPTAVLDRTEAKKSTIKVLDRIKGRGFRGDQELWTAQVEVQIYDNFTFRRKTASRQAYFLSGYDMQEPGLSYFFCEIDPTAEPQTISDAYRALRPRSVVLADRQQKKVKRQGDMFFIRMEKGWTPLQEPREAYLHKSNHYALSVSKNLRSNDGLTYVQGDVMHRPDGRPADHRKLRLGTDYWWLCVPNAVPVARPVWL